MLESITADDIISQILMLRTVDSRTVLLVEGPNDCATLDPHIDSGHCHSIPTHGVRNLYGAVWLANEMELERLVALADSDWQGVMYSCAVPNIVLTDAVDLDATCFLIGRAFDRVLSAYTNRDALQTSLQTAPHADAREWLVAIAATVGALRLASVSHSLGLRLDKFPVNAVLAEGAYVVDLDRLVAVAVARTSGTSDAAAARGAFEATACRYSPQRLANGHDLVRALRSVGNVRWGLSVSADTLERAMRAATSCAEIKATGLYQTLRDWASERRTVIWSCP